MIFIDSDFCCKLKKNTVFELFFAQKCSQKLLWEPLRCHFSLLGASLVALWPSWGRPFGVLGPSWDASCNEKSVFFRFLASKGLPKSAQASLEVENSWILSFFAPISLRFSCCSSRQLRARSGYGGVAQRLQYKDFRMDHFKEWFKKTKGNLADASVYQKYM